MTNRQFLTPMDVNKLPSKPADHRITYGRDPLHLGDLRLPRDVGLHPVAIVVHGDCWVSTFADLQNSAALSDALRDAGIATWNIEYRRVDHVGGGWPGTFDDIASAVDHVHNLAAEYNLDLNRVIAIGHSAGATLALWATARSRLPLSSILYRVNPLKLCGAISLGGPGDLKAFANIDQDICGSAVVARLIGGSAEEFPQRYREASPIEMLPLGVPQIFITGEYDFSVPKDLGHAYTQAAQLADDDVQHIVVADAAHHEYCAPSSVTWPTILQSVRTLLG